MGAAAETHRVTARRLGSHRARSLTARTWSRCTFQFPGQGTEDEAVSAPFSPRDPGEPEAGAMEEEGSLAVGRAGVQQRLAEMGRSSETDRAGVWLGSRVPA